MDQGVQEQPGEGGGEGGGGGGGAGVPRPPPGPRPAPLPQEYTYTKTHYQFLEKIKVVKEIPSYSLNVPTNLFLHHFFIFLL